MTKTELTKSIILTLDSDIYFKEAYKNWWYKDIRDTNFRLKPEGFKFFKKLIPVFKFKIQKQSIPKTFKDLSNLNCPYYINHPDRYYASQISEIFIFSDKVSMTAQLYLNFNDYLKTLK